MLIAEAAEFVAGTAERAIETLTGIVEGLLGGGSSAPPTPTPEPSPTTAKERHEARLRAFQERERQQQATNSQAAGRDPGAFEAQSPEELKRKQERDRGGGQSLSLFNAGAALTGRTTDSLALESAGEIGILQRFHARRAFDASPCFQLRHWTRRRRKGKSKGRATSGGSAYQLRKAGMRSAKHSAFLRTLIRSKAKATTPLRPPDQHRRGHPPSPRP